VVGVVVGGRPGMRGLVGVLAMPGADVIKLLIIKYMMIKNLTNVNPVGLGAVGK